ncbi:hypothetical protein CPB84DRAFT_1781367 [Gymnopilus junonius]|uniref:Uncharacterized protein n=1 Tax=Gymnopilus junonius TaxID=109634 RepID=A0A9P5NJ18_GYMJU|nr:hypothetical protein CPB84DRAFT_1781367 [Gymnopilus junonius]
MINDPPSTLKPAEVAALLVQHAVKKHKDRYENIFFKAVGFHCWIICSYLASF